MARPTKWRKIEKVPAVPYFLPSDKDTCGRPQNMLLFEELEAVRLKDLEGLEQEECAQRMQVSRPTFQRILLSAREKIADSLINGKVIHVAGGKYTQHICPVKCVSCGREWKDSFENLDVKSGEYKCPVCGSDSFACAHNCIGKLCKRSGRRF